MSETPAWLNSDTNANAGSGDNFEMTTAVTGSQPTTPLASATSGTGGSTISAGATEEDNDLPGVILTMRLANMGVAIALVACSVRGVA